MVLRAEVCGFGDGCVRVPFVAEVESFHAGMVRTVPAAVLWPAVLVEEAIQQHSDGVRLGQQRQVADAIEQVQFRV